MDEGPSHSVILSIMSARRLAFWTARSAEAPREAGSCFFGSEKIARSSSATPTIHSMRQR